MVTRTDKPSDKSEASAPDAYQEYLQRKRERDAEMEAAPLHVDVKFTQEQTLDLLDLIAQKKQDYSQASQLRLNVIAEKLIASRVAALEQLRQRRV